MQQIFEIAYLWEILSNDTISLFHNLLNLPPNASLKQACDGSSEISINSSDNISS